jgi:hypothetical protein
VAFFFAFCFLKGVCLMNPQLVAKYRPYPPVHLPQRQWPNKTLSHAPVWCSVDLRDGNQALIQPMSLEKKLEMFQLLTELGFIEIEVGFPRPPRWSMTSPDCSSKKRGSPAMSAFRC